MRVSVPTTTPPTTERRLLSSSAAAYASQLGRTLIRVIAELILARLLLDSDHGLFERALGIVVVAGAVRDLGLLYQVVRDEHQPFGTVLVWVSGVGGLITAALALGAGLFAALDPQLPAVLRVLSIYVLLDGLAAVPRVYFERRLAVGRLVMPELLRGLLFATVAVGLAFLGWEVWSFVVAELAGLTLFTLLAWRRAWGQIPLAIRLDLLGPLLARSYLLALVWLATAAAPLVGRYVILDSATVGQYNKAHLWALRLHAFLWPALARVFYPALVEYRGDRRRFVAAYGLGTLAIAALEILAAYVLFFNAEVVLLEIFLGPRWEPAVPLLRILCFLPLVEPLNRLGGEVLKVRNEDRLWLVVVLLNLACLVGFGVAFTRAWGAAGMAWANYLLLGNLLMAWRLFQICGRELLTLLRQLATVYLLPLPLFAAVALVLAPGWGRFWLSMAAAAVSGALLVLCYHRPYRSFFAPPPEHAAE